MMSSRQQSSPTSPYSTNMTLKWHQLRREEELDHTSKGVEVRPEALPDRIVKPCRGSTMMTPTSCLGKRKWSKSLTSRGLSETNCLGQNSVPNFAPPLISFKHGQLTPSRSKQALSTHPNVQLSLTQNGSTSSKVRPLTLTMSSPDSTRPPLTINAPKPSVRSSSNSESKMPQNLLPRTVTGPLHSILPEMPISSPSPTEPKSLNNINALSYSNL